MKLTLKRIFLGLDYTIGKLFVNGDFFCDTLEDLVRDLNKDGDLTDPGETKVYGATAIPYGTYKIIMSMSPKFKRMLPRLVDVPGFEGVLIHAGNTAKDTEGCILVGRNKIKGSLTDSRVTENALTKMLMECKEDIYITIE